jgi:hypothetical protein
MLVAKDEKPRAEIDGIGSDAVPGKREKGAEG